MRSPSPSKAMPRSNPPSPTTRVRSERSVAPQPTLMFVAVRRRRDRCDLGAEPLERLRRDARVRAVCAVDRDPEPRQVAPEALDDVLEVAVGRDLDPVDLAGHLGRLGVEKRLDLLLGGVRQLPALSVEELDAVVLGRVVGGRDDRSEIEREQGHGRGGQDSREHRVAARRRDSARQMLPRARARIRGCPARRRRGHDRTRAPRRGQAVRQAPGSGPPRRSPEHRQYRSTSGPRVSAWRTEAPCAPCGGRPSCAPPCARRA